MEYQLNHEYARIDMIRFRPTQSVTVAILGLGDIGQYTGKMLRSFDYNVLGFKRRVGKHDLADLAECADHVTTSLDQVLTESDYLINLLPSTSATRYVLNETNLELCRSRRPVFINIGRGDAVSEKTLVKALNKGRLSRAVLDVFEKEPLPKDSLLWEHPSVLLTPHVSGKVFPEDVAAMFLDNFNRYLKGEPVRYKVDWVGHMSNAIAQSSSVSLATEICCSLDWFAPYRTKHQPHSVVHLLVHRVVKSTVTVVASRTRTRCAWQHMADLLDQCSVPIKSMSTVGTNRPEGLSRSTASLLTNSAVVFRRTC